MENKRRTLAFPSTKTRLKQEIYYSLPKKPHCYHYGIDNKPRDKKEAIKYPFIQLNSSEYINFMVFDLDHENSLIYEDVQGPCPTVIIRNRLTGHCQYVYKLEVPVKKENIKSLYFYKSLYLEMANVYQADPHFKEYISRNPILSHQENQIDYNPYAIYSLDELLDYKVYWGKYKSKIEYKTYFNRKIELKNIEVGNRNESLFHLTRFDVYHEIQTRGISKDNLYDFTLDRLNDYNDQITCNGVEALPPSEIKTIARSITRYCSNNFNKIKNWTPKKERPLSLKLKGLFTLKEKQRQAAYCTQDLRRVKMETKIIKEMSHQYQKNGKLNITTLAKRVGCSRQNLYKSYKDLIQFKRVSTMVYISGVLSLWLKEGKYSESPLNKVKKSWKGFRPEEHRYFEYEKLLELKIIEKLIHSPP